MPGSAAAPVADSESSWHARELTGLLEQTAEAIASHQSAGVELQIDERIRERVSASCFRLRRLSTLGARRFFELFAHLLLVYSSSASYK